MLSRKRRRVARDPARKSVALRAVARWVVSADHEEGEVAADALEEVGMLEMAEAVRYYARRGSYHRERDSLARRIHSEIRGRVIRKGEWRPRGVAVLGHGLSHASRGLRCYVAIFEPSQERVLLWEGRHSSPSIPPGQWRIWGTYDLKKEFPTLRELMKVLDSDIRSESQSLSKRIGLHRRYDDLYQEGRAPRFGRRKS